MIGSVKCIAAALVVLVAIVVDVRAQESCVQCSSESDVRCVESSLHFVPANCTNATISGCFSRIVNGFTVRGCGNTLAPNECANDEWCNTCFNVNDAQGCNNQQFPEIRLACHQCSGDLNSTCAESPSVSPVICNIFEPNNQCFIRRSNETIVRGCISSSEGRCDTREHCWLCDGAGCNLLHHTDPAIPDAPNSSSLVTFTAMLIVSMAMATIVAQ